MPASHAACRQRHQGGGEVDDWFCSCTDTQAHSNELRRYCYTERPAAIPSLQQKKGEHAFTTSFVILACESSIADGKARGASLNFAHLYGRAMCLKKKKREEKNSEKCKRRVQKQRNANNTEVTMIPPDQPTQQT
jgi:hypothetical protein